MPFLPPNQQHQSTEGRMFVPLLGNAAFFRIPILTDFLLPDNAASSFLRRVGNFCHMFKLKLPFFAKTLSVAV